MSSRPVIKVKLPPPDPSRPLLRVNLPPMSFFKTGFAKTPCGGLTLADLVAGIREGRWKAEVERCRSFLASGDLVGYESAKRELPAVMLSARVKHRRKGTSPKQREAVHSRCLQIDLDGKDNPGRDLGEIGEVLKSIPWIVAVFISPSGNGVKAIARCPADFDKHAGSWHAAATELERHGLKIDPSTKDSGRLCFVSYDPEAWQREGEASEIVPAEMLPPPISESHRASGTVRPEFARKVAAELVEKRGRPKRDAWVKISSAFFQGCGVDTGIEVLEEAFPPEEEGEYQKLARSLPKFIPWETLRSFGVDPIDPEELIADMPDCTGEEVTAKAAGRKTLADFRVNHLTTLGHTFAEIDALRPPVVIDGFLRQGEVLLLGAESKSRKSWLAQDAAFAVAAGLPWLADTSGANGFATTRAGVHILDLELNPSEMRYRFAKARANRFAESQEEAAAMTAAVASYSLDGLNVKEILIRLVELKATAKPGDLAIIDCLYRLCPDGNEVKDLAEILEGVKRFAAETRTGVILVDHFRKAGDEKARNRFAGSFVKQASASTLVAIEVTADDVLVLNIDARTFHGCPKVHARFNPETYAFNRLPEIEVEKAKQESRRGEAEGWILRLWNGRAPDTPVTAADAAERWAIKRQAAVPRLGKLVSRGWLLEVKNGTGRATEWKLSAEGVAVVKPAQDDI